MSTASSQGEQPESPRRPERAERVEGQDRHPGIDPTVRMFEKDWMEKLSHVYPWVPHAIYVPVVVWMIWRGAEAGLGGWPVAGLFVVGGVVWSAVEWVLHQFVFHEIADDDVEMAVKRKVAQLDPDQPIVSNLDGWREKFFFVAHGVHHHFPADPKRLVMPPSVSVPLAVAFYFLFDALLGATVAPPFFAGFLTGYLFYDSFHYAIHFIRPGGRLEALMYRLGKGHMRHHFSNPDQDYGVSTPIWDLLLGTYDEEEKAQFWPERALWRQPEKWKPDQDLEETLDELEVRSREPTVSR